MDEPTAAVEICLRIPGKWANPRELFESLPSDCRFTPESLVLPDGQEVEFGAMDADNQFAGIFRTSCRQPACISAGSASASAGSICGSQTRCALRELSSANEGAQHAADAREFDSGRAARADSLRGSRALVRY